MINGLSLSSGIKNYLKNNIKSDEKILILISCGLDSTVLFDLIKKSKYFKNENVYYLIFDHQKRSEGKYEINQFIKFYNLSNKNIFLKKINSKNTLKGFQEKSRTNRINFLYNFSKKRNIENVFFGHRLDDLNETFFMRKIQQSNILGLSNIFSKNYKDLKFHRPLTKFSKILIKNYANKKKLIWFEDRTNLELDYTRNKIRHFLYSNKLLSKIDKERLSFIRTPNIKSLHQNYFIRKRDKFFEIEIEKFSNLNEHLKYLVIHSFYHEHRYLLKKQIRDENIINLIELLKIQIRSCKERSIFSGKLGVFNKKICINLT